MKKTFFISLIFITLFYSGCGMFGNPDSNTNSDSLKNTVIITDTVAYAMELHHRILTLDSHTDTPLRLNRGDFDLGKKNSSGKIDLIRMKEGGLDAVFFAVFLGQGSRTPEANALAKEKALVIFQNIHDNIKKYDSIATLALTPEDAFNIEKTGKRAIYIGLENGYPIGNDISAVEEFFKLGARYITLCHTANNDICDSANDTIQEHNGLSEFGIQVVKEMNRLGMMIDVSHISDSAFYDVLAISKKPVIASHSCARSICNNKRNLTDDMLRRLAENGGVIQMCILSDYVKEMPRNPQRDSAFTALRAKYHNFNNLSEEQQQKAINEWQDTDVKFPQELATVKDMVDHIDHIVEIAGIDHVGIGTDFDGGGGLADCFDVSQLANITLELVRRGYSEEDIAKIWGENFLRVWSEIQ